MLAPQNRVCPKLKTEYGTWWNKEYLHFVAYDQSSEVRKQHIAAP